MVWKLNKKGEPTLTFYIVTTILIILGFVIIFFLLTRFNLIGIAEDEVCRLSILSRATSPQSVSSYIPIECTTKKKCLEKSFLGGSELLADGCEEFRGEDAEQIKLSGEAQQIADQIEKITAEEMLNCWSLMGEGKLNIVSGGLLNHLGLESGGRPLTCMICSRIALNLPESEKENVLNQINLKEYLRTEPAPNRNGLSYLSTFTDTSVNSYSQISASALSDLQASEDLGKTTITNPRRTDEIAIVFTQTVKPTYTGTLQNLAGVGAAIAGPVALVPALRAGAALTGPTGAVIVGVAAGGLTLYSMSNVYADRHASAAYCGALSGSEETGSAVEGCSGIQVVPYDFNSINQICDHIEGNV